MKDFSKKTFLTSFRGKEILVAEDQPLLSEPAEPRQHLGSLDGKKGGRYFQQLSNCEMRGTTSASIMDKWRTVQVY